MRDSREVAAAGSSAPATGSSTAAADQAAELIIFGGPILTMDDAQPSAGAVAVKDGKIVKVELKRENGRPVFEFDVEGSDKTWDVECDARSGKITEVEQEVVSADSPQFKEKARISLEEAKAIALKK